MIFLVFCAISIAVTPSVEIGLDQELSMPEDSFVLKYFQYMKQYLSMGPPVYWVVKGNTSYVDQSFQNRMCSGVTCDTTNVITQLFIAATEPDV